MNQVHCVSLLDDIVYYTPRWKEFHYCREISLLSETRSVEVTYDLDYSI